MEYNDQLVVAIDVGGSKIRAALVDRSGTITARTVKRNSFSQSADTIVEGIIEATKVTLAQVPHCTIFGIGVAAAGQIDPETGSIIGGCLPGIDWIGVPLGSLIQTEFSLPVKVDNDANAAALGEHVYGKGRGHSNLLCITVGTGIGGGIILNNEVYHGNLGSAGEIGHISVDFEGPRCTCGNRGCLEMYSSGTGIARLGLEALSEGVDSLLHQMARIGDGRIIAEQVFEAARNNDSLSLSVLKRAGSALGAAIASLIHAFNPEIVLINGGVSGQGSFFLKHIVGVVERQTMTAMRVPVMLGSLGPDAGLLGAAALIQRYIPDSRRTEGDSSNE